jgi:hypothetical protein
MLMEEAKGLAPVPGRATADSDQVAGGAAVDPQSEALTSIIVDQPAQARGGSPNYADQKPTMKAKRFLQAVIRKLTQDDQSPSPNVNDTPPTQQGTPPNMRKASQDKTTIAGPSSKMKGLKLTIPITISKKRLLKRKSTRSKSPKKRDGRKAEEGGTDDGPDDEAVREPLTAHSIVQQVSPSLLRTLGFEFYVVQAWAQGVQTRSTFFVIHSGNYEYICIRHRATQTLYVSDILHVPFVPGYMKLQIGLYIAGLDDAFRRYRSEKALETDISSDGDGQGPGSTDHDGNNGSDNDDDQNDDQPKSKRRRGHDQDSRNPERVCIADKDVRDVSS